MPSVPIVETLVLVLVAFSSYMRVELSGPPCLPHPHDHDARDTRRGMCSTAPHTTPR